MMVSLIKTIDLKGYIENRRSSDLILTSVHQRENTFELGHGIAKDIGSTFVGVTHPRVWVDENRDQARNTPFRVRLRQMMRRTPPPIVIDLHRTFWEQPDFILNCTHLEPLPEPAKDISLRLHGIVLDEIQKIVDARGEQKYSVGEYYQIGKRGIVKDAIELGAPYLLSEISYQSLIPAWGENTQPLQDHCDTRRGTETRKGLCWRPLDTCCLRDDRGDYLIGFDLLSHEEKPETPEATKARDLRGDLTQIIRNAWVRLRQGEIPKNIGDVCSLKSKAIRQEGQWCIKATKHLSFELCPDERVPIDSPETICAESIDDLPKKIIKRYGKTCAIAEP